MEPRNLLQIVQKSVTIMPHSPCFRFKEGGSWQTLTYEEVYKRICDLAGGLHELGIKRGDKVCIFSRTRPEWSIADLAILANGAVSVPIYESSIAEAASYIVENSEAKIVIVENDLQLAKLEGDRKKLENLHQIILMETQKKGRKGDGIYTLDEVSLLGAAVGEKIFTTTASALTPDDVASYVYTSGTTGNPKGAVLTHGNFIAEIKSLNQVIDFPPKTESLLFLPLAHIFARVIQFAQLEHGFVQCYAESIDRLMDNILEVKPHLMASVPRIFEKVHTKVLQGVEAGSDMKKKIFAWALSVGQKRAAALLNKKPIPISVQLQWPLAYKLVFSKLHAKLGGRISFFISGGAPLSKEIGDFFHAAGFLILEGYGLTETTAAITCNSPTAVKVGTVGRPVPGVDIKIAEDGEILVRGGVVFQGYFKSPEATKEAIDEDGWFHTGDIGEFDKEGFLKITDRKKDIIVTAGGKNIAPQNIESFMKLDPLISQVMVHGDKRKFLSALITLDKEELVKFAKNHKIPFQQYEELVSNEKIYSIVKEKIEEKNRHLAKYETIKKFAILTVDFSVETGELTPTMKVKRKFTSQKYQHILDQFYQDV